MNLKEIARTLSCLQQIDFDTFKCVFTNHTYHHPDANETGIICCPLTRQTIPATTIITYNDLCDHIKQVIPYFVNVPIDVVVAIPRSGLLPATILATYFNLPLYTLDLAKRQFIDIGHGSRPISNISEDVKYLIIDDSAAGGATANNVRTVLNNIGIKPENYILFALYASEILFFGIDLCGYRYPLPHFYEWNLTNCWFMAHTGASFEDTLVNKDNILQYAVRSYPLKFLVVQKKENLSLAKQYVKHRMLAATKIVNCSSSSEDSIILEKANFILKENVSYYIENNTTHAQMLADLTGVPIICLTAKKIICSGPKRTV